MREIDHVMGKLVSAMAAFAVLGGASAFFVIRMKGWKWSGVKRWSVISGLSGLSATMGGYWYRVYVLTNREEFLLQLGADPRYSTARARFKRKLP